MPAASWFTDETQHQAVVEAPEEAIALLRTLGKGAVELPPIVSFQCSADGPCLAIGAGDPTVLTFQRTLDPPYYESAGDGSASGTLWFQYGGSASEFPASAAVSIAAAAEVLRQFFESDDLPSAVNWTET